MAARLTKSWGRQKPPPGTGIDYGHHLGQGLLGAWPFNDRGGQNQILDATGRSIGDYTGRPLTIGQGPFGPCPSYNGTTQLATLNSQTNRLKINTTGTLSLWWRSGEALGASNHAPFNVQISAVQSFGILFYNDGNFYCGWYDLGEYRATGSIAGLGLVQENWYHLALIFQNGTNAKFFVNGQLKATASSSQITSLTLGSTPVQVGYFSPSADYSPCSVDNIRIYDKVLSVAQIRQLYTDPWAGYYAPRRKLISPPAAAPSADLLLPSRIGYSRFVSR